MVKLLERYLMTTIFSAIALVLLILIGLEIFMMFVDMMEVIGQGEFTMSQAFIFVLLAAPYQVYLFFPVATMLGCLLGLGMLASNSELIVMRANGLSIAHIIWVVLKALLGIIILMTLLGEFLFPKMVAFAEDRKATQTSEGKAIKTSQGVWVRDKKSFIHIGSVLPDNQLSNITEYSFNDQYELQSVRKSESASYQKNHWELKNSEVTTFQNNQITAEKTPLLLWSILLKPSLIASTKTEPTEMNLFELHRYLKDSKRNALQTNNFELVFWQRLLQPLSCCVMMILAIPFIFGPLRSATLGSRFLIGATVGFGYHLLNKFFGPVSMVYQLPPFIAAMAPTVLFLLLALWLMKKVR